jgi:DNA ligase (NAD+)
MNPMKEMNQKMNKEYFTAPTHCPVCKEKLQINGVFLECVNEECKGRKIGNVLKWIQKLELKGIAESTIEKLYDAGLVSTPADLYRLTKEQVKELDGFKERSTTKLIETIHSVKTITFGQLIGGLNIPNCSDKTGELLEKNGYDTVEKVLNTSVDELSLIKGMGDITVKETLIGLNKKLNLVKELMDMGIQVESKKVINNVGGSLSGKSFVFTGAVETTDPDTGKHYTREKLQTFVVNNGGVNHSSLKKDTNYLVQADPNSTSSKSKKAKQFGTEIISEAQFFRMIGIV